MTTLQATDRQEIWEPRWLAEVATSSYFEPRLFSTEDLQATTGFYHGRLMTHPTVERNFTDTFWGITEVSQVAIQLDNADNALDFLYTADPRGKSLVLRRYDRQAGTVAVEFTGTINDAVWSPGVIELSAVSPDLSIFEQVIPKGTVQAASGIDGMVDSTTAVDLGASVPVIYGNVTRHQLIYVSDDIVNDKYDYLVGVGILTVSAVYRRDSGGTLHPAAATEYSVLYGVYGNTTIVRFLHRQIDFGSGFYPIHADVTGLSAERNFVRAIRTMLSNTVYGLGQTINAASFDAAEALLDPVTGTAVTGLYADGIFTARPARDCLRDLLMIRGMRLDMNASGEWVITVDTEQTVEKLLIQDGTGVGERTLLGIRNRRRPPVSEKTSNLILRFRPDPLDDSIRLEVRRGVNSTGVERIIEHPYIRDTTTADKVVYYLATREKFGLETVEVDVGQEGRSLSPGDLVRLTYAPIGYSASTMEVRRVRKGIDRATLLLGAWTSDFYGYSAGSLPTEPTRPIPNAAVDPLKVVSDREVFTPLSTPTFLTSCVMVDEDSSEIDWLIDVSGDLYWGETNFDGGIVTALGVRFSITAPTSLSCCWDPYGSMHIVLSPPALTDTPIRHAKLSKNGVIERNVTNITSPTGGDDHLNPSVAFGRPNGKVYVVYFHNDATPGVDSFLTALRLDVGGNVEITGAGLTVFSALGGGITGLRLAIDSTGDLHIMYRYSGAGSPASTVNIPFYLRVADTGAAFSVYSGSKSQPFSLPQGVTYADPLMLFCDNDDFLHVLAAGSGGEVMYGRLNNRGRVVVQLTVFETGGSTYLQAAGHFSQRTVFLPRVAAGIVYQKRLDLVESVGPMTGMFAGVSL